MAENTEPMAPLTDTLRAVDIPYRSIWRVGQVEGPAHKVRFVEVIFVSGEDVRVRDVVKRRGVWVGSYEHRESMFSRDRFGRAGRYGLERVSLPSA